MATFGTFVDGVSLKASELNGMFQPTSFTPTMYQLNLIAPRTGANAPIGRYYRVNDLITCQFAFTSNELTGTGTATNRIEIDLPFTAASNSMLVIGHCRFNNFGQPNLRAAIVQYSTTKAAFLSETATSTTNYLGASFTIGTRTSFVGTFTYEIA